MACFSPLQGYLSTCDLGFRKWKPSGILSELFSKGRLMPSDTENYKIQSVPCGQCIGCRLERSRNWAIRCVHEASLYDDNSFITLTYDPEHLPPGGTLVMRDFQLFMKRLRKRFGEGIRFFHCGEYGDKFKRPHYHAILFNCAFSDQKFWKKYRGNTLYTSEILSGLWPKGWASVGAVTFESAAYVARYCTKKVNGDAAKDHYMFPDLKTGQLCEVKPEYCTMSRRPGLGKKWFDMHKNDVYPTDEIIIRGRKMKPPKFYDSQYEALDEAGFEIIKRARKDAAEERLDDSTCDRLRVREVVCKARNGELTRPYEKGETL